MEFRDLKAQFNKYKNSINSAIQEVIRNTNFIGGKEVDTLEKRLAEYVGVKHCITCANGTERNDRAVAATTTGLPRFARPAWPIAHASYGAECRNRGTKVTNRYTDAGKS